MRAVTLAVLTLVLASSCVSDPPDEQSKSWDPVQGESRTVETAGNEQNDPSVEIGDVYKVKFETSKGDFVIEVQPEWAPRGAAQFKAAVEDGVYDDARFFRAVDGFMVQFGIPGDPQKAAKWRAKQIQDDPVQQSNTRGMVSFAMAGPNTRTTQLFINFGDNSRLDSMGFSPFGHVVEGMDVVDALNKEYGERPSGDQQQIQARGNAFLDQKYPNLDSITKATVVEEG